MGDQPRHGLRSLSDIVCHEEQMTVWEDELIADLSDFLQPPQDYAELLALHRAANIAIRRLVVNAFCHPAIPAVSTKGITT